MFADKKTTPASTLGVRIAGKDTVVDTMPYMDLAAFGEGYTCRQHELLWVKNPYPAGEQRAEWYRGWTAAAEE